MASIREKLASLEELQKVDLEILAVRRSVENVPARLQELSAMRQKAAQALEAERTKLMENDRGRRMLEQSVQDERDKIKKWEGRLGDLKTTAQYAALAREVDISKKQNKTLEDEILRLMGEAEELRTQVALREAELKQADAQGQTEAAQLQAQKAEADSRVGAMDARRAELATSVEASLLSRYEQIRKHRMGVAVVSVRDGRCTGCNMAIPPQLYNTLRTYVNLETCPHCHRIIYAQDMVEAQSTSA